MKTIWKTALKASGIQEIDVPAGARFLCAREQHEEICVWYICDPDETKVPIRVAIIATGQPAPELEYGVYIGTVALHGGSLIFHVFVEKSARL